MAKIQIQDLEPQSFISEVDANELETVQGGFVQLIWPAIWVVNFFYQAGKALKLW
jgi:hypothetical protein